MFWQPKDEVRPKIDHNSEGCREVKSHDCRKHKIPIANKTCGKHSGNKRNDSDAAISPYGFNGAVNHEAEEEYSDYDGEKISDTNRRQIRWWHRSFGFSQETFVDETFLLRKRRVPYGSIQVPVKD